jgi:hypothetical protein
MKNVELIKSILNLLDGDKTDNEKTIVNTNIYSDCIGKHCIIRSYGAGVFFGIVEQIEDNYTVKLTNARRIHYWDTHTASSCTDLALYGINESKTNSSKESRVAKTVDIHYIQQIIEVIPCAKIAIDNLINFKVWSENE